MARAKREPSVVDAFALGFPSYRVGASLLVHADAFAWLAALPECSLHAVVTDPPYGVKEYEPTRARAVGRRASGACGVSRRRSTDTPARPLPRFTALTPRERAVLEAFFADWGARSSCARCAPAAHVFLAGNAFLSQLVFGAVVRGGLEFRGEAHPPRAHPPRRRPPQERRGGVPERHVAPARLLRALGDLPQTPPNRGADA
ncbi:MAG: hypothetical protein V9G19_27785 [Tetrasphaera sp.]